MELEEAIEILNNFKSMKILNGNIFAMNKEQFEKLQEAIKIVLQALENSIPKKKIEEKIKEYMEYDKKVKTYTSDGRENFTIEYYKAKTLQELLEGR